MFDLDQALARWRDHMGDQRLSDPDVLNELESHLRDEFEAQVRSGIEPQQAFDSATKRIGSPDTLRHEFARSSTLSDNLKNVFLTLAGIPNQNLATTMNNSRIEPAWATYLKATTFLIPAMLLATLAAIFVVPKLQQICNDAGLPEASAGSFWNLIYSSIQLTLTILHQGFYIAVGLAGLLLLLEWRVPQWPRYRRAAIGCGAFVLNSLILFAFFMMFMAAIVAAPALARVGR